MSCPRSDHVIPDTLIVFVTYRYLLTIAVNILFVSHVKSWTERGTVLTTYLYKWTMFSNSLVRMSVLASWSVLAFSRASCSDNLLLSTT